MLAMKMLGASLRDHIENQILRQVSGLKDIVVDRERTKFVGRGHVAMVSVGKEVTTGLTTRRVDKRLRIT